MARSLFGGSKWKRDRRPKHRRKMPVRRGDRVRVVRGNYRGQEGDILRVLPDKQRVVVEGVNMHKRHRRPTQDQPEGGIVTFEAPIHVSNVMLIDPRTEEPTRFRINVAGDGSKERISVKSGAVLPQPES